jgi:hypothetical protein
LTEKNQAAHGNFGTHIETFALFIEENPFEKGFFLKLLS